MPNDSKTESEPQVRCDDGLGACVDFIQDQLVKAFADLKAREQMEQTWRGGDDATWRAVGCTKTKRQRIQEADMQGRIAEKKRKEVALFKAVLERLKAPND